MAYRDTNLRYTTVSPDLDTDRRIIERDDIINERHGLVNVIAITPEELLALLSGKVLEIDINGGEYTCVIALNTEETK